MDIYSIGTEKCIDGVWGRELDGRFYTYYFKSYNCLTLYRKVDVDNEENDWFVSLKVGAHLESVTCTKRSWLTKYTPKHIKDLENLKPMDIVWVKIHTSRGVMWGCTRFIRRMGSYYVTGDLFCSSGHIDMTYTSSHEEVYLKPPFDI